MSSHNSFNMNKKDDKQGRNIQVVVRCRPFNNFERKSGCHGVIDCEEKRKEIIVRTGTDKAARKTYTFDMVFGQGAKQIDVYRSVVYPILDEVIMGYNCTVFAYGQTGTGKTFTMEGERSPNEEFTWEDDPLAGVIPRTLHQIFEKLTANGTEFSVKVSLLEIYNEELFDLLSPGNDVTERLQLFDDPRNKRGVIVKGLGEIVVHNKNEVYQILERGAAKRKTAATLMNAYSSRSHSVFSVTIHMKEITDDGEELVKIGKLNLVDLAGSENIGRSGAVDKRAREAGNINQSLLTLGRVITALVEKRPHVPYRESKLTRILQDSLGGHTKTSIIATVSPASSNLEETLSTLDYANRAKNIMNKPEVNQKLTKRTLIKEYTEEIERLKRDLAATREKNGVYVSSENYESMSGMITSQEEQITEYTDRIALVEEELKRAMEMFEDSKSKLDQCTMDLEERNQELHETHKDLQDTKQKLFEEELVVSELATTEQKLYTTADTLLTTVDASTKDVSGLHAKLDRKRKVEEQNSEIQHHFTDHMEVMFSQMQSSLGGQRTKHQHMLDSCRNSVEGLLTVNDEAFKTAFKTVATSFSGITDVVTEGMTKCQAKITEQETLCLETKNILQQVLEEHKLDLEDVLMAQVLPGVHAIMAMTESMKKTLESHRALATEIEAMKQDMSLFFTSHVQELAALRETATTGFTSMKTEHLNLKEQISRADKKHETAMSQVTQCLQNQLSLLAVETRGDFAGLMAANDALQAPVDSLQKTLQTRCSAAEGHATTQQELLDSTASSLVTKVRQTAEEADCTVEECAGACGHLQKSLTQLADRGLEWCSTTNNLAEAQAQTQLGLMTDITASTQTLQQGLQQSCEENLLDLRGHLEQRRREVEAGLGAVRDQTALDQITLENHQSQLAAHIVDCMSRVNCFLTEELSQDVPTGKTPQRRPYVYPRVLSKSKSRVELLDILRQEQEQAATSECDTVEEKETLDQDSLEDEASGSTDSNVTEASSVDEDLVCLEIGRVPFFKQKKASKASKKENKNVNQPKMAESESLGTPRSKLPLRSQN